MKYTISVSYLAIYIDLFYIWNHFRVVLNVLDLVHDYVWGRQNVLNHHAAARLSITSIDGNRFALVE